MLSFLEREEKGVLGREIVCVVIVNFTGKKEFVSTLMSFTISKSSNNTVSTFLTV